MIEPTKPPKGELKRKFPEWVLGVALDGREFVIHLHWPRFIGEVTQEYMEQEKGIAPVIQLDFIDAFKWIRRNSIIRFRSVGEGFLRGGNAK